MRLVPFRCEGPHALWPLQRAREAYWPVIRCFPAGRRQSGLAGDA